MLSRSDFIFTIGYDGHSAVVDGQAKKLYSKLSAVELAKKGLFRAAYSSAICSKDPKEPEIVAEIYNKAANSSVPQESFQRLFGVFNVDVDRSIIL
jgi:hypothetical protein